jgi:hypothetical protein
MYQLLYCTWKNYNPNQNKFCDTKKNVYFTKQEKKSFFDTPSNDKTIDIVVNNDLIKAIDNSIDFFEKESISIFSCF